LKEVKLSGSFIETATIWRLNFDKFLM